jgi:hypothetical protein
MFFSLPGVSTVIPKSLWWCCFFKEWQWSCN